MIILRAHHLLCLLGFRGYGYSVRFIDNLRGIHKRIKQATSLVKIVAEEDDICRACPFVNKECREKLNPAERDLAVISKLKIEPSSVFKSQVIYERIAKCFNSEDLTLFCKGCQWFGEGWCKEGLEKLKSEVAA